MTDNRHPAGTSIGGRWAPGSAAEIDDSDFTDVGDERAAALFMQAEAPEVPISVTYESYSDRGYHLGDFGGDSFDAREWLHAKSLDELEELRENTEESGGYEEAESALDDLDRAGHANIRHTDSYRASLSEPDLDDYIEERRSRGLSEPLVSSMRRTHDADAAARARILSEKADVRGAQDVLADTEKSPEERASELRARAGKIREDYIAAAEAEGVDPGRVDIQTLEMIETAPKKGNPYEDAISTANELRVFAEFHADTHANYERARQQ